MSPGPCRDGLTVEGGLVLGRWHVADRAEESVGAHAAAAFVASEVFRHALPLKEKFQWHAPLTEYSVFDYGVPESGAPDIEALRFQTVPLLVGVGAIGQACVDTLASLRTCGAIRCVDKGYVDDETNLNRSVLALEQDLDGPAPKVGLATRRVAGSDLRVIPHLDELSSVLAKIDAGDIPWPKFVASALDSPEDRRALQGVWPDVTLDAATGGSMAQIFRYVADSEMACLRCLHADAGSGSRVLDALLGLAASALDAMHAVLNLAPELVDVTLHRFSRSGKSSVPGGIGPVVVGDRPPHRDLSPHRMALG